MKKIIVASFQCIFTSRSKVNKLTLQLLQNAPLKSISVYLDIKDKTQFASVFSVDQGVISTIHAKSVENSINTIDFNGERIVKL